MKRLLWHFQSAEGFLYFNISSKLKVRNLWSCEKNGKTYCKHHHQLSSVTVSLLFTTWFVRNVFKNVSTLCSKTLYFLVFVLYLSLDLFVDNEEKSDLFTIDAQYTETTENMYLGGIPESYQLKDQTKDFDSFILISLQGGSIRDLTFDDRCVCVHVLEISVIVFCVQVQKHCYHKTKGSLHTLCVFRTDNVFKKSHYTWLFVFL